MKLRHWWTRNTWKQTSAPFAYQMVNPDVRDDMPIADFTAASLREDSAPQEVPHKQKYHNLGFSSVIVADVTNVGDPRLVKPVHIAHAALSIGLLGFSFFFKEGGANMGDPWLACRTVQRELHAEWLVPPPPSPLLCFCFLFVEGVFCFRVWWQ